MSTVPGTRADEAGAMQQQHPPNKVERLHHHYDKPDRDGQSLAQVLSRR